jgi:hypothetical protein
LLVSEPPASTPSFGPPPALDPQLGNAHNRKRQESADRFIGTLDSDEKWIVFDRKLA